ncbi:SDR family NAD(P)-dependent oxidoreductase, partial [Acinetobacter baumannii]
MKYDLNKKVVLITGAAGGIGAATARECYALGANLVLTDMQEEAVDKLA